MNKYKIFLKSFLINILILGYRFSAVGGVNGAKEVSGTNVFNGTSAGDMGDVKKITIPIPIPDIYGLVYWAFFAVMGFFIAYNAYFLIKRFIKFIFMGLAIYVLSLIILNHFNLIIINSKVISDYINYTLTLLLLAFSKLPSPTAFMLGIVLGFIYAFSKDNKIKLSLPKKPASSGGGAKAPPKK